MLFINMKEKKCKKNIIQTILSKKWDKKAASKIETALMKKRIKFLLLPYLMFCMHLDTQWLPEKYGNAL